VFYAKLIHYTADPALDLVADGPEDRSAFDHRKALAAPFAVPRDEQVHLTAKRAAPHRGAATHERRRR
jgi:hypothetical protein